MDELKRKLRDFFRNYGKVTLLLFSCLLIFSLVCAIVYEASPKKLTVSFLDVGQGDAILIQTPSGHDMLIDGGPTDAVLARLGEKLNYFDRTIEVVVATHGDADHVTGLIPVLKTYRVEKIIQSPIEAKTGISNDLARHISDEGAEVHVAQKGDLIDFGDGVVVHVLHPATTISLKMDTNDASVSVVLVYGNHSFLLTGDLTSKYEASLIGAALPRNVTVYKAGHHGSNTSSGAQLLSYARPEYSVISAGKDNRYGHPHPEALERLEKYSKEVLSTVDHGTISFESDGRLLDIEKER